MNSLITSPVVGARFTYGRRAWWHMKDHFVPHSRNNYQPHVLHHRTLTVLSVLLLTAKVFSLSALEFTDQPLPAQASEITQGSVLDLTNKVRIAEGLGGLQYNATLQKAAQAKADDMAARKYFSHTTPDGKTPWTFFEAAGYVYQSAGENLAVHFADVEPLQDAWMNSPGHRANIMSPKYTEMGVGIARGEYEGYESVFVVELFGLPSQSTTASAPQPTAVPTPASARAIAPRTARAASVEGIASSEQVVPVEASAAMKPTQNGVLVEVVPASDTVKALVMYGSKASMLVPKSNGMWQVTVPFESLQNTSPVVQLYTMSGSTQTLLLGSVQTGYFGAPRTTYDTTPQVHILGHEISVDGVENKVYVVVIALLLTALIIALAVHERLRHVRLIANASFVVFFAALLLVF